jgi:Zn-dependent oligopeptidase
MNLKHFINSAAVALVTFGALHSSTAIYRVPERVTTIDDIVQLCSYTVEGINTYATEAIASAQRDLDAIIAVPESEKTFGNTMLPFDLLSDRLLRVAMLCLAVRDLDTRAELREAACKVEQLIEAFGINTIESNSAVYHAMKLYESGKFQHEQLSPEQRSYVHETLRTFIRYGLDLDESTQERIKQTRKGLAEVCQAFTMAISADQSFIAVPAEELIGLSEDFINGLPRTDDGLCKVTTNNATALRVLQNCSNERTRQTLWKAFMQRAYPENNTRLQQIIALRDTLATLLGYKSYAHFVLAADMIKSPESATEFLNNVHRTLLPQACEEFTALCSTLPEGVALTEGGKIKPWDTAYLQARYRKQYAEIDEQAIAEYFPTEQVIARLLTVYEQFFGIKFTEIETGGKLWHPSVRCYALYQDEVLRGHILFDLYPRPYKYSNGSAQLLIKAQKNVPGVAILRTAFPLPTAEKPALLMYKDVVTFFHECGHAIHFLLNNTEMSRQEKRKTLKRLCNMLLRRLSLIVSIFRKIILSLHMFILLDTVPRIIRMFGQLP